MQAWTLTSQQRFLQGNAGPDVSVFQPFLQLLGCNAGPCKPSGAMHARATSSGPMQACMQPCPACSMEAQAPTNLLSRNLLQWLVLVDDAGTQLMGEANFKRRRRPLRAAQSQQLGAIHLHALTEVCQ